ncbi:bifunctional lytic transglycosylase/C40 family peptidase [Streptomyces sp. AM 3-1-1]|uniref:C40 family peptidase n=2 Tax=unclassified Streptomyces TaxID=2593676 RepID=UPI0023BA3BEA|nr:bifunctional lytic transglycosylase/C40 family peptidase [Streptomyces sp. AM 3-1-1]WEH28820.1 bifunctional lytic transglycosylase/C40 family peptidase [Streptomyces sp. AM 3-1-1]
MRKFWLIGSLLAVLGTGFVALLVVGVFIVAGNLTGGGAGRATGLAKGSVPAAYQALVQKWGNLCPALTPALLASQLYQESGFNPRARSAAAAEGIAQFIPSTWASHGVDGDKDGVRDVWNPADAIPSAASYDCELASYVKNVPGDQSANMLAAYNAGPDAVIRYGGIPPYSETRNYVKTIRGLEESFSAPAGRLQPSEQAAAAISYAQGKLGTPYLWGGTGTAAQRGRFDCSGLTQAAYESVGIDLPRVANDQYNAGPHPARNELLPGDLVFFSDDLSNSRAIRHVGIYVGGGYMIDAPRTGAVIRFDPVDTPDYFGATRVTQAAAAALPEPGASESLRPVDEDREAARKKAEAKEKAGADEGGVDAKGASAEDAGAGGGGAEAGGESAVAGEPSGAASPSPGAAALAGAGVGPRRAD